ncbi:tRNA (adenosine(37)-N6)-dimethylallyltransferase MiaA [Thermogemmatispora sp.]|uniref:tRNA (adenosine(37)-N6)-dimethylallyltransferase MiaA n=1 Tax=Thermogemmatispora sp. TaxID=1968838 RepID=UPI001D2D6CFF|nr:tRNA (adenosine(37)-N6)-dimethylallyltransferase MiaA [Thermogemmatispora sp.]MBX5451201.1 tRNA (adenosine(37)-N6)-dimethylallyltransferase MiaA [Thermogemmatispora sp.]
MAQPRSKGKVVVVLGPTASGKSALGIQLAQRFNGEIVSADSRQVYRGLDIGTAKVTPEERAQIPHHLLDVADPSEVYSAARFREEALAAIDAILSRGKLPLLVGGSPHYIQLVVDNLQVPQVPPDMELRRQLEQRPLAELVAELERRDPHTAAHIDRRNPRRVIRALEVCLLTGRPFSEQQGAPAPLYESLLLGIHWPRAELYRRIDQRVDERLRQGMVDEVRRLLAQGISHERLEALGLEYRFISRLLRGEYESEAVMAEHLKHAIHDFARRQLSWFRRDQRIIWLEGPDLERATTEVARFLGEECGGAFSAAELAQQPSGEVNQGPSQGMEAGS